MKKNNRCRWLKKQYKGCAVLLFVFEAIEPTKTSKRQNKGKPKVAYV